MKRLLLFIIFLSLFPLSFSQAQDISQEPGASQTQEESVSLYLSPSSGSFLVGSTFSVSIFLNTEDKDINLVWSDLEFPADILQVTSPTAGSSFISDWIIPPNYSNQEGLISFRGGIPNGIKTSAGLVSKITFRAVAPGRAEIKFRDSSKVIFNDGQGTLAKTNIRTASYQILPPLAEGPQVVCLTHPNSSLWYSDNSPSFSWAKESGVTGFSWSFNQNPQGRPDGQSEGMETAVSFSNVDDGIWYFHIRQKKDGLWGKTTDVPVKIDTHPGLPFEPRIEYYTWSKSHQALLYFNSEDNFSGVDYYKVSFLDLNNTSTGQTFFSEATSPYPVPFEEEGEYKAIVQAVDKAGNIREATVTFNIDKGFLIDIGSLFVDMGDYIPLGSPIFLIATLLLAFFLSRWSLGYFFKRFTGTHN